MTNIQKTNSEISNLIKFPHNNPGDVKPFLEDIFLISVYVAGTYYIDNICEIILKINKGDHLDLFREKNNKYDSNAILVKYNGEKIGYVPKKDNVILANLMDADKKLYGVVEDSSIDEVYEDDYCISIRFKIFLKE